MPCQVVDTGASSMGRNTRRRARAVEGKCGILSFFFCRGSLHIQEPSYYKGWLLYVHMQVRRPSHYAKGMASYIYDMYACIKNQLRWAHKRWGTPIGPKGEAWLERKGQAGDAHPTLPAPPTFPPTFPPHMPIPAGCTGATPLPLEPKGFFGGGGGMTWATGPGQGAVVRPLLHMGSLDMGQSYAQSVGQAMFGLAQAVCHTQSEQCKRLDSIQSQIDAIAPSSSSRRPTGGCSCMACICTLQTHCEHQEAHT